MYRSILINVKDEHRYLPEWLEHHLNLGFDHIYVVEDFNSSSHRELLDKYIQTKTLSLHRMEDFGILDEQKNYTPWRQVWMYNRFFTSGLVQPHKDEWCVFLDTDEFLMFKDGYTLNNWMFDLDTKARETGDWFSYIVLRNFNASGHIYAPNVPTVQAYKHWEYREHDMLCKSVVNVSRPYKFFCIQRAMREDQIQPSKPHAQELDTGNVWINHYFTKSWEDWLIRMRRGSQDPNLRKLEQFFDIYNKDMMRYKSLLIDSFYMCQNEWMQGGTEFIPQEIASCFDVLKNSLQ